MRNKDYEQWTEIFSSKVPFDRDAKKLSNIYDEHSCDTDTWDNDPLHRLKTFKSLETAKLVVGLGDIIPLWNQNIVLRWRLNKESFKNVFNKAEEEEIRTKKKFEEAISLWGDARPVDFIETDQNPDFEIVMKKGRDWLKHFFRMLKGNESLRYILVGGYNEKKNKWIH